MNKQEFKHHVFSLSERIYPMVARMLGQSHAEDAIQDIMLKLWEKRNNIKNHPNIKGLVFLTSRNYCLDILRKKRIILDDDIANLKVVHSKKETSKIEWKELNAIIQNIIQNLPQQQKEVFEMRDLDGFETAEVAQILAIKQEHVRVLLSRARKQIGKALEKDYNYERGAY